jgi:hypothetical protein
MSAFPALREIANSRRLDPIQLATELALGDDGTELSPTIGNDSVSV